MGYSRRGRVRAPELTGRGGWINTRRDLSLEALKGKVVLLDFWTFCCVNCLHVLDELRPLEERFGDDLVVIGVHSPKFEHERDHEAVERAVARYDVRHPVLDDPDRVTWDQYGVRAWPTLVLVDPQGYAVAAVSGEGNASALERVIARMIEEHRALGTLDETPVDMLPPQGGTGTLRFPGKVATGPDGLLAVADSGHNRVVVARTEGDGAEVLAVAGTGARGAKDGGFAEAGFTDPQGLLFLDSETLLVADTGNHQIRRLDLSNETVETVAGTGDQARWGAAGGPAGETPLNSPWDLELWDGMVGIAMAGPHQLWVLDLEKDEVSVLAGSGMESLADGPVLVAAMAQPSGLSSDGEKLWVVDSETSSLRYLDRSGHLLTTVGAGLFDFGYKDGPAAHALLQHPLGVVATSKGPVVCDTYNSALRCYDRQKNELATLAHDDLSEPSGAALLSGTDEDLVVADTNNHRLVRVGPDGKVWPFEVRGLQPPAPVPKRGPVAVEIGPVELAGEVELTATLPVPDGQKLDTSLGPPVQLSVSSDELLLEGALRFAGDELPAKAQLALSAAEGSLDILLRVGTCEEGPGAACNLAERRWRVAVRRDEEGSPRLNLGLTG
ncbi:MAG: redoxin domain-containing protein [Actinomycetota bacterium]|nr:redoxin domain-containing protein [Actinomycetota bacterium]